jgi:hypothetical protein
MENSTPINQHTNLSTIEEMDNNNENNSQIVDEIISEMNSQEQPQTLSNEQDQYLKDQNAHLDRQMDNSVNMTSMDNLNMMHSNMNPGMNTDSIHEIDVSMETKEETLLSKVIKLVKNPLLVIAAVLLIFSPFVKNLLIKYLPKIFSNQTTTTLYLSLLLRSVLVSLVFFTGESLLK